METQAYFENIQSEIHRRLMAAESQIDLAVAWFTDRLQQFLLLLFHGGIAAKSR